jgi:polyphenol oxidase
MGSSALGLSLFPGFILPRAAMALCEPPGTPGTPSSWRVDCRPIRPRRPASSLSDAEVQKLADAYRAMRLLDTTSPNDPRAFHHQANVHCWYCGQGAQVHGSWQFFAWHRAYLYFHERILGSLIGDMDFRLPYWDWDTQSHRKLPPAYVSPGDVSNPLWNETRVMTPAEELPEEDVGDVVMEAALTAGNFSDFGGTVASSGIPEGAPHGSVHVDVGGDMGVFATAARDPIFYAHHSNVDKMWSDWNRGSSAHTNPTDPQFLQLSWNFFDESKVWRSITAAQVLNYENQLRYTYGVSRFAEILPCLLAWIVIRTDWQVPRPLRLASAGQTKLLGALDRGGRARLHIDALVAPTVKSAVYRLYTSLEAANADEGPKSKEYVGAFPVVLNGHRNGHQHKGTVNVAILLSRATAEQVLRAPTQLALVERGVKQEVRAPAPLRAKSVYFSVADVAH